MPEACLPRQSRSRSNPPVYFFPLFLIPWLPVFRGPFFPFADAAISLRAFSSRSACQSVLVHSRRSLRRVRGPREKRTGPLLLLERQVVLVEVLHGLLRGLERLGLAACLCQMLARAAEGQAVRIRAEEAYHHVLDHPFRWYSSIKGDRSRVSSSRLTRCAVVGKERLQRAAGRSFEAAIAPPPPALR